MTRFVLFLFLTCVASVPQAQPFPSRPIEIVNAFAPGGANDLNARALQIPGERILGQPLVQIFKQGGGGIVGSTEVANAPPDGYKLLLVTSGELTAAPNLAKTSYTLDSFSFLGRLSSKPYALVVRNDAPWKTFGELLRATNEQAGRRSVGTTAQGGMFLTAQHLIKRGGVQLTTVPYGGAGPALTALLGGHIDSVWAPLAAAEAQVKAGALRLLAVTGSARVAGHAGTPTFKELGIDAPYVQWTGLVAPKGLPAVRLAALRDAIAQITSDPVYLQLTDKFGIEVAYGNAEEFEKQVRDEDRVFRALVKDFGLTPK
jgi:tripartite-type tricarboxylate transporter receptor subunit TctC